MKVAKNSGGADIAENWDSLPQFGAGEAAHRQ
jgi:hypothetical protein